MQTKVVPSLSAVLLTNPSYRRELATGSDLQLVGMHLLPGEDIHEEVHEVDQYLWIRQGDAIFTINGQPIRLRGDGAIFIPAGTLHRVQNASSTRSLYLLSVYGAPLHEVGGIQKRETDPEI